MQISPSCFDIYTGDQLDAFLLGKTPNATAAAPCPTLPEANETTPKVMDYRALGYVGPVTFQVNPNLPSMCQVLKTCRHDCS